ncbi:MAG: hypothetical protein ISS88_02960 [Candidatus Portnoybacteria bacterium]|nr:hypothetical protein [Candidatus Portnoybacteria bacterium]
MDLSKVNRYEELSFAQWVAVGNKLGGLSNVKMVLHGELDIETRKAVKLLFDSTGRRIPEGLPVGVCDANRSLRLNQPELEQDVDYANRITRLHECLGVDTGITAEQFKAETERLLALIWDNSQIANIANGVWLPVILPKLTTNDIGETLEQYLEAVGKSYVKTFSDRRFYNYRKGMLVDNINIIDGSCHDQLIERMKQGPVMGINFPNPLQGFSINASREQISTLPEGFILSGMDTLIAMAMYPDVLARDWNTPGLDLAAFSWRSAYSLIFGASALKLDFDSTAYLAYARDSCSGGLLFLG